jgi:hypothetical protein
MLTNHIGLNVDFSQVVGRVHGEASMKVVERLNTTAVGLNDEPVQAMRVSDCGPTDSQVLPTYLLGRKRGGGGSLKF